MRQIQAEQVTEAVAKLCIDSNYYIGEDIRQAFCQARCADCGEMESSVLDMLLENAQIAGVNQIPLCQDTGMAVVFVELGQDAQVIGGNLEDAINEGVRRGYEEGYLRKSVVADPIRRVNTKDNTPAVVHYKIVPGDSVKITVSPKGFGSENMSRLVMLKPSQGIEGIRAFIIETVKIAGPNPCPPIIVGVGIGGTMEKACLIAKEALLRNVGTRHPDPFWDGFERELLDQINALGIGPAGLGGKATALAVHICTYATHIAGLPVAVNIGCHATRHAEITL